jgi:hypothetical protein
MELKHVSGNRIRLRRMSRVVVLPAVLLLTCSAPIRQFYPDHFFPEDNVYKNEGIGFLLTLRGKWNIITDPNSMNRYYREFAATMQASGGELLFMGSTVEELYGIKAVALNLNEPPREYATYIRELNKDDVDRDTDPVDFITGSQQMVKWVYDRAGYRFAEFFFVVGTYDIRLSFWTKPQLFENFLPVFEEIVSTVEVTNDF